MKTREEIKEYLDSILQNYLNEFQGCTDKAVSHETLVNIERVFCEGVEDYRTPVYRIIFPDGDVVYIRCEGYTEFEQETAVWKDVRPKKDFEIVEHTVNGWRIVK